MYYISQIIIRRKSYLSCIPIFAAGLQLNSCIRHLDCLGCSLSIALLEDEISKVQSIGTHNEQNDDLDS